MLTSQNKESSKKQFLNKSQQMTMLDVKEFVMFQTL